MIRDAKDLVINLILMVVTVGLIYLIGAVGVNAYRPTILRQREEPYRVWCNVYERQDVSFEDWQILRTAGLLPKAIIETNDTQAEEVE